MKVFFSMLLIAFGLGMNHESASLAPSCSSTLDDVTIELQTLDGIQRDCVEPDTEYKLVIRRNNSCFAYYCVNGMYGVVNRTTGLNFYQCQDAGPVTTFYFKTNSSGVDIEFFISGFAEINGVYTFLDEISVSYSNGGFGGCSGQQW